VVTGTTRYPPTPSALHEAVDTRDPRYDGVFFVAIRSTGIYCRPICPSRRARRENRVFFASRGEAEDAGFRPCRRCRPELAPGQGPLEVVPRVAGEAVERIATGALDGRSVRDLAEDLGLSERHLRRAIEREFGVAPRDLAAELRLRKATDLLRDTALPVTRIAYLSGFQSLRRFNAAFLERHGMPPSAWRRAQVTG